MTTSTRFSAPFRALATPVRRLTVVVVALVAVVLTVGSAASAEPSENGCNGLYEVARFATFQQVGETHGHETVHHQFELHGCDHHH